jgi:hypothetical protein
MLERSYYVLRMPETETLARRIAPCPSACAIAGLRRAGSKQPHCYDCVDFPFMLFQIKSNEILTSITFPLLYLVSTSFTVRSQPRRHTQVPHPLHSSHSTTTIGPMCSSP